MVLEGKLKWVVISAGSLLGVVVIVLAYRYFTGHSGPGEDSRNRWFVDAETHQPFRAHLEIGQTIPIISPFTKRTTGYEAELCYWNKDGTIKTDPTPVLVNTAIDPNDKTPTFCPDCGRLVVGHNPPPVAGHPPPTQQEWVQRHGGAGQ